MSKVCTGVVECLQHNMLDENGTINPDHDFGITDEQMSGRREKREHKMCPWPEYSIDPKTGRKCVHWNRCREDDCPNCIMIKAGEIKRQIENAFWGNEELVYVFSPTDSDTNLEIKKKLRKAARYVVPMANGNSFHLVKKEEAEKLASMGSFQPFTNEVMQTLDYAALAVQPSRTKHGTGGKQASGSLGKIAVTPPNNEETVVAKIDTVLVDLPYQILEEADEKVETLSQHLDPRTVEEAVEAANEKVGIMARVYEEFGGEVEISSRYVRLDKNVSIRWFRNNSSLYAWETGKGLVSKIKSP